MRYVQLRAFHYVATHGGFSRAARELHLTQPAISDQVRKLEEEYDVLLFSRQRKQIALTPAGEKLLAITRRMFDTESQALDLLSESRALRAGRLRLVVDAVHHVLPVLAAFRAHYPGVAVSVRAGNTETVMAALMGYEAEVGVLGEMPALREVDTLRLDATPICAFVAVGHPLAREGTFGWARLARLPLVMREPGSHTRQMVEAAAARAGVELGCAIEAEGREAVREIVARGLGVGFICQAEFGNDPRLVSIPLEGRPILMEEVLVSLSERAETKAIHAFFETARGIKALQAQRPPVANQARGASG